MRRPSASVRTRRELVSQLGPILEKEVEVEVEVENLKTVVEANISPGRSSVDGNSG